MYWGEGVPPERQGKGPVTQVLRGILDVSRAHRLVHAVGGKEFPRHVREMGPATKVSGGVLGVSRVFPAWCALVHDWARAGSAGSL